MEKVKEDGSLKDIYSNFIAISRYARWIESENRRETWVETVERLISFMKSHIIENHGYKEDDSIFEEVKEAILNHKIMPSMRSLMTAGPALERDHIASYNCSFIAVDNPRSFDEAMYILMNGTGVGFSVEQKYTDQLPVVAEQMFPTETTIVVEDSKLGWAKAYKELVALLYQGQVPNWDMSKVRPAGARLVTFGGRASGPEPLDALFHFTADIFRNAAGRRLKPIEAHDIMCKIGEVVVVGGVRRSALISLSNLDDFEMAKAKSGKWWESEGQRALANNSAVYNMKPNTAQFLREWRNLYESKSGERGIYNLDSVRKHIDSFGRRDSSKVAGTNPSLVAGTRVWTDFGIKEIQDLEGQSFKIRNIHGNISSAECWKSGENKKVYSVNLSGNHYYEATEEHKWPVLRNGEWIRTKTTDLNKGDLLPNLFTGEMYPQGIKGEHLEGFVIGWNLGDGWITERPIGNKTNKSDSRQIGFIVAGETDRESKIHETVTNYLNNLGSKSSLIDKTEINVNNPELRKIFDYFGVQNKKYGLPTSVWDHNTSDDFRKGIVDGLISSDGSVDIKSKRIVFVSAHENLVKDLSSMLGFFGIKTSIEKTSRTMSLNGNEAKEYVRYTLKISRYENIVNFYNTFALSNNDKQNKIKLIVDQGRQKGKDTSNFIEVKSVEFSRYADVWDISVYDETHAFQIDHVITGNCGEILLRANEFCNLTEVVIEASDTEQDLINKVRLASILGTWQSTLTNFKYIRKSWKDNCEEERLLGVSLTGIYGNKLTSTNNNHLANMLDKMREVAVETNKKEAAKLGINESMSVTCVKPSGTVSQLTGVSSGIHPWYSQYYIRSVRADNKDPLTVFLKDCGIPNEPDVMKPNDTTVFYFPIKAPKNSITTDDISAIDHLEMWKTYRNHWTEHNPSVTINIHENEWMSVGAWVYENFDDIGGVSFLPASEHTYKQAPYQACTKEEYDEAVSNMPKNINWEMLTLYETEDGTSGSQELSCVAGSCDYVSIGNVESQH